MVDFHQAQLNRLTIPMIKIKKIMVWIVASIKRIRRNNNNLLNK